jgi:uncharacterized lipoprotein YajG
MTSKGLMAAVACLFLAGCAADGTTQARRPLTDNDFVTGSRIPQRDKSGVSTVSREQWDQAVEMATRPIMPKN